MKKLLIALSIGTALASSAPSYAGSERLSEKQALNQSPSNQTWIPPSIRHKQNLKSPSLSHSSNNLISANVQASDSITAGTSHYTEYLYTLNDFNLQSCIQSYATQNGYQWVSDFVALECHGYMISDLTGIENYTSLTRVMIASGALTDLSPLALLPSLTHIDVWGNQVASLSGIASMSQLEVLIIGENPTSDLSALNQLTNLKELALPSLNLNDLSLVSGLSQLQFLDIGQNPIQDYSAINSLTYLKAIHLDVPDANKDISSMLGVHREWEWLGVKQYDSYCWQLDYIEKYHTFLNNSWYRPSICDSSQDWDDFDGDGIPNYDELQGDTDPLLLDTDNDGTPDGQLPGGDSYIWDAMYAIPDYSLQQCVNDVLIDNPAIQFASEITNLECQSRGISSLQGLEAFIKLKILNISDNMQIADAHILGQLPELEQLDANNSGITDISWVSNLTKLTHFWIVGNQVSDITAVQNLTSLIALGLPDAGITEISIVANLVNLQYFDMGMNPVTDISGLQNLNQLKMVDLSQAGIKDISPILRDGAHWEWLGVSTEAYCWQLDYLEEYNTFEQYGWYRPYTCDFNNDWADYDGDGLPNLDELNGDTSPILFDSDNDGTPDGQLPGGDRYIWDALQFIQDNNLYSCLQSIINADPMIQYASQITTLNCQSRAIYTLQGIEAFIGLTELEVSNNNISDLTPITSLPNLTRLLAFNNQLTSLDSLAGFNQLNALIVGGNNISDISVLAQLTNLQELVLPSGGITDISALATLTQLKILDTETNPISDLSVISQLTALDTLGIWSYTGSDIAAVLMPSRHWQWLGVNDNVYCWQLDYLEQYHTFAPDTWYRPYNCDSSQDYSDYDGDLLSNYDELMTGTNPLLLDTDNDGTPDGQLPGGDSYIWDAYYQILDMNLQNCIYSEMMLHPEWEYASQLTELNCSARSISQLTGIDKFIGLVTLDISSNTIADLSPVYSLPSLQVLLAMTNPISNLSGIEVMSSLQVLILFDTTISDISPIWSLTQLSDLALPTANFTDMSLLNALSNILFLDIGNNPVTDLTGFNYYNQLKFIGLDGTQVQDISPLFDHTATWEWIGLPPTAYCWQSKYIEDFRTFEYPWYPNVTCDNSQDYQDYDGDGIDNWNELHSTFTDPTIAN